MPDDVFVVDASVVVDFVLGGVAQTAIAERIADASLHAPAHLDAEVLSAIGRIHRAGALTAREAGERLDDATEIPVTRHLLGSLVRGAWQRRERLGLPTRSTSSSLRSSTCDCLPPMRHSVGRRVERR